MSSHLVPPERKLFTVSDKRLFSGDAWSTVNSIPCQDESIIT